MQDAAYIRDAAFPACVCAVFIMILKFRIAYLSVLDGWRAEARSSGRSSPAFIGG